MRILGVMVVFICTLVFAIIGGILVAFSFNLFTVQSLEAFLQQTFQITNIHLSIGGIGLFLIIASIFIAQVTLGRMQREKTIAFNNPDGQVTVSLSAIENFIKRLSSNINGIRDLRSNVVASKKGIEVTTRVCLWAEANIPETTETIQTTIKNRLLEMLGIEDPIIVRVDVVKIVEKEKKHFKKKGKEEIEERPVPFQGNIEYGKD